jgi:ATP-binding cassette subfamily B protein
VLTKILGRYLHPYRVQTAIVLVLLLAQAIAYLYLPLLNAELINKGVAKGDVGFILHVGLIMLASSLAVLVSSIALTYLSSKVAMAFGRDLRRDVFGAVEKFSTQELNKFGAPSLITRNTNDVQQVQMVLFMGLTMMISAPITGIGAAILAVHTNLKLSSLILVTIPVMSIIIFFLLRRVVPLFRVGQVKIDRINQVLREQISGIRVIRAFVKTPIEEQRFDVANNDLMENTLKVTRTFAFMFPSLNLVLNLSSVAVIWMGARLVDDGNLQVGDLTAFLAYLLQILYSVMMAVMMSLMIPRAATSADRIQEVLGTASTVVDPLEPVTPAARTGVVEFRDVEFRYPGAEHPVLQHISFTAKPATTTAIVGSTGSGKSTLLNLLSRFMDPSDGQVLIDGVDIKQQSLESVWDQISLVPQRSYLFGSSLSNNLRYGKTDATDEQVWDALETAQAAGFVRELPELLDTSIAQGGTNLSGGQRQRVTIARALIKDTPILLLDDSFSALDFATDAKLRAALDDKAHDKTIVIVGQRVSSIMHADQILVLDEGQIVGCGTHQELLESCTVYQEIVYSQLSPTEAL